MLSFLSQGEYCHRNQWIYKDRRRIRMVVSCRSGPIMAGHQAVAFAKTQADLSEPNLQIHMAPTGSFKNREGHYQFSPAPCITLMPNISRPLSRGTVTLRSRSPYESPEINPNMLGEESDVAVLIEAGKLCRSIIEAKPLSSLVQGEPLTGTRNQVRSRLVPIFT